MNHNFRILIVNSHNTVIGGNDMAALSQLKLLQAKGVPVALFSKEDVAKPFSPTRKQDFIKYFYSKSAGRSFTKVIEQFKPDIIHIHSFSGYLSNSLITMLQRVKVPAVFTVHDYRILCPFSILFQQGKVCMQCPQSGSTLGVVRNRCNRNSVVLSGVNYLDHLIAFKWLNFVDVIHRFHFVSAFSHRTHCHFQPRLETKSEYFPNFCFDVGWQGVKPHKGYILYLGRLAIGKGLVRFLEAYIKLTHIPFTLKIAGTGDLEEAIKSLASQDSRIELTGFVSGQQKQELLQHAAFTLLPSEWLENNPISLIESLAAGIPVIGSNRGGIPEMVVNGKSGFIFNHDEPGSIENMLAGISTLSPAHWEQLSVNARRHYEENYTPDIHFSNLMAFYHNTLKRES